MSVATRIMWKVTVAGRPLFDNIILCVLVRYVIVLLCYVQTDVFSVAFSACANETWGERSYIISTEAEESGSSWFRSVVVITSALHAEGPRFDPGRNQCGFFVSLLYFTQHSSIREK